MITRAIQRFVPAVLSVLLFATAVASAARKPQGPPVRESHTAWIAILYAAVMAACVCVVAFKNAKRTHLD